jgi:glucokinase
MTAAETVIVGAMDVGGSHVSAALVAVGGGSARIVARAQSPLDSQAAEGALLSQLVAPALSLADAEDLDWTIALPGPFDYIEGRGSFAGVGKFQSIADVDLRDGLGSRLRVDGTRVRFINDAEAYGRGEWSSGARPERFVCITLGTGVGSVFLDNGVAVTSGDEVPPQGWVHLLEYDGRPLEESISTDAIRREYARLSGREAEVRSIANAARRGDRQAAEAISGRMRILGIALGPWFSRFRATEVVIGGAMSQSWDLLEAPLRAGVVSAGAALPSTLRASELLDDAPLVGAALSGSATG